MTTTDNTALNDKLRAWAKGAYNTMAAVDFLIATSMAHRLQGVVHDDEYGMAWISFPALKDAVEEGAYGYLSSGELATLKLAVSLACGELDDTFWRFDRNHQNALIAVLTNHR